MSHSSITTTLNYLLTFDRLLKINKNVLYYLIKKYIKSSLKNKRLFMKCKINKYVLGVI